MIDFTNIFYLNSGNSKQQRVYKMLREKLIMEILCRFDPILAGTIPIKIDIDNSDLDIICCFEDQKDFIAVVNGNFSNAKCFNIKEKQIGNQPTVIANFIIDNFEIEIFGQNIPTRKQFGYRHMIIEQQLLLSRGEIFRNEIIKLKQEGFKTEPAFAKLLGLVGDPYLALLTYENECI